MQDVNKYENGYEQIITTEKKIGEMQKNLTDLKPQLLQAAEDTQLKMQEVEIQKGEADKIAEVISKEEAIVKVAVDEANQIKQECEKDLEEAMPLLLAAEDALRVLEKKDLDLIKSFK